jgi:hypothetical protein
LLNAKLVTGVKIISGINDHVSLSLLQMSLPGQSEFFCQESSDRQRLTQDLAVVLKDWNLSQWHA